MAETYDFEDRKYIDPNVALNEQKGFIDRLREIENKDLQKIATDTHNLGTDVTSNLGGLSGIGKPNSLGISGADTGSAGIWRNRFERPQTNALVSDLKATMQADALNTSLNNMLSQYKNRYNQEARKAAKSGSGGGTTTTTEDSPYNVNVGDPLIRDRSLPDSILPQGSYFIRDANGNIKDTMVITTDVYGRIYDVEDGSGHHSRTDGDNYIDQLKNNGYTFWNSNGEQVDITSGAR